MNLLDRMNMAIDYVEKKITDDLELSKLAQITPDQLSILYLLPAI